MMHLLIVTHFWPTVSNPVSGIFVVQQLAAFCRAGCRVTVFASRTIGKRMDRLLTPDELGLPSDEVSLVVLPFLRLPEAVSASAPAFAFNVRSSGLSMSKAVASAMSRTAPPAGCIIHGLRYHAFSLPRWGRNLPGRKIAFIHGVDPFLVKQRMTALAASCLNRSRAGLDKIVLVGSPLRFHALSLGLDASGTVVIPNGTDVPALCTPPPNSGADGDILRIVSVSNLVALKGVDDNIRALSLLSAQHGIDNWRYTVVGDGPERGRLQALAASLGLNERIEFPGRLSYPATMNEIANADIFSLPSWGEAFGIVYLEAMARGRPAIGCLENGAADIITDGKDGLLVPPGNHEAVALAIRRLFRQPDLRRAIGRQARLTAEGYSWDVNAGRVLRLLDPPPVVPG